jgi:hypothetical protein
MDEGKRSKDAGRPAQSSRALTWWFGLMSLSGLMFGALGERRPFGGDLIAHPIIVFFALVAAALLALRFIVGRPVPEIISDRMLVVGCFIGIAAFLVGNWFAVHLAAIR